MLSGCFCKHARSSATKRGTGALAWAKGKKSGRSGGPPRAIRTHMRKHPTNQHHDTPPTHKWQQWERVRCTPMCRRQIKRASGSFKQYTGEQICKYFKRMSIVLANAPTLSISMSYPPKSTGVTIGRGSSADTRPISASW